MPETSVKSDFTTLSASELTRLVRAGEASVREVVDAHIARIEAVNPKLNAVVFERFTEARKEADAADALQRDGGTLGALHGVPITVKECYEMAGTPWTIGVGRRKDLRGSADGPLVARLREAGAIVLGKCNLPQFMLSVECDNPVYGRSNNPWDLGRAPGGSSGGDAAIVAAGGAAIGLGGDIGGSLRNPAHVCGIHTLKATSRRMPGVGSYDPNDRQEAMPAVAGPLARSVPDLVLAMEVLAAPGLEQIDPYVPPVPWRDPAEIDVSKLRIGYYEDDAYFPAAPALRRAVREGAAALRDRGATVEVWRPLHVERVLNFGLAFLAADGGKGLERAGGDSQRDYRMARMEKLVKLHPWLRSYFRGQAVSKGQQTILSYLDFIREFSVDAYWNLLEERRSVLRDVLYDLQRRHIDAVLSPPAPLAALTHGATADLGPVHVYTAYYNVLGLPAGVVAATRVRAGEESDRPVTRDGVLLAARKCEEGSAGLPVGVHVSAAPWREDIVLAVMATLERHFRAQPDYPARPPI
jgi:fatty acid amide hydrolase